MLKQRNSNIELLRIISILMIVISHYTVHNGINNANLQISINRFLLEIMTLGNIGTILFALITGYFLIQSNNKIKFSRILKLWLQVFFYSTIIYIIFVLLKLEPFSVKYFIKTLLPISYKQYWFASAYIILYIFYPFINKLLNSLTRNEYLKLIFISLFIFSILSMLTNKDLYGNELIHLVIFYIIGAYFGKYSNNIFNNKKFNVLLLIITTIILISSVIVFDAIGIKIPIFATNSIYLFNRSSIITILFSISLFNIFANKIPHTNKYINIISSCVFGIYLISDNDYVREVLWSDIFKNADYVMSKLLIPHMIVTITIIFVTCILIELIRKITLEKIYDKHISKKIDKLQIFIEEKFKKFFIDFTYKIKKQFN